MRQNLFVCSKTRVVAAVFVEVIEQATGLIFFDIETGEANEATSVVTGVDNLGLNLYQRTIFVGLDGHFVDVEAELIQALDAAINLPLFFDLKGLGSGEFLPKFTVFRHDSLGCRNRVDPRCGVSAGDEVH